MKRKRNRLETLLYKIPTVGIFLFVALYFYASTLYPGGSQADLTSEGFSWLHNYWCNLLNKTGMNGQINPARPVAISAMLILCFSLAIFFIQFAKAYIENTKWKVLFQLNGVLSMFFAAFIFSPYHDLMTIISSLFGSFVVLGILKTIYSHKNRKHQLTGLFCLFLLALNNYIYYTQHYLEHLPLLQKLTFATVLLWILILNASLKEKIQ